MNAAVLRARCRALRVIVTDVDGVLTDGGMYYGESGEEMKKFSIRDGAGVALLKCAGIVVGAMTGESRGLVVRRAEKMGMDFVVSGARHKPGALGRHAAAAGFSLREVGYVGDEINDLSLAGKVGVFFAVADAAPEVRRRADHVLATRGGEGALREVAAIVLRHRGVLDAALEDYLQLAAAADGGETTRVLRRAGARPARRRK